MQIEILDIFYIFISLICLASVGYLLFAIFAVERFNKKRQISNKANEFSPAVTILKPIYGLDPEMEENLRSFCKQDYSEYQIIFGLQDKNDPAIPVVKKIINEFKHIDASYVVDQRIYGCNHKVSNLINMYPNAKHDYLLIADSDMRVPDNYLNNVMAPFNDEAVGAVTCLYSGSARGKLASKLNAMFINEWFLPSVLISRMLQPIKYCLGATMIIRRKVLDNMDGFNNLSNYLADDYMLGKHVTEQGYKIHLSDFVVENIVEEPSLKDLVLHELRWARTLRTVEPWGFFFTFLTDTLVISFVAAWEIYFYSEQLLLAMLPIMFVLTLRIILHKRIKSIVHAKSSGSIWLIPVRDFLSFTIRLVSFTGNSVKWRNNSFSVDTAGVIHSEQQIQTELDKAKKIPDLATTQDY
jgi:ceramide glucosyltransferase